MKIPWQSPKDANRTSCAPLPPAKPSWGEQHWEQTLCFASEPEVYREFERLEQRVPPHPALLRTKQLALQLVQTMQADRGPVTDSAHAAFKKLFPKGFKVDC